MYVQKEPGGHSTVGRIMASAWTVEAIIRFHSSLQEAESSVITQIRTGRIDLAAFLNRAQIPHQCVRIGSAPEWDIDIDLPATKFTKADGLV
jgi:hypothetical protein